MGLRIYYYIHKSKDTLTFGTATKLLSKFEYGKPLCSLMIPEALSATSVTSFAWDMQINTEGVLRITSNQSKKVIFNGYVKCLQDEDYKIIEKKEKVSSISTFEIIVFSILLSIIFTLLVMISNVSNKIYVVTDKLEKNQYVKPTNIIQIKEGRLLRKIAFPFWLIPNYNPSYEYSLHMQNDGNAVMYEDNYFSRKPVWSSNTNDCYELRFVSILSIKLICKTQTKFIEFENKEKFCNSKNKCISV